MRSRPTVYVVDDDEQTRDSVCILVRSMGIRAEPFCSAEEFLANYDRSCPGCLIADVRLLGMSGIELLEEMKRREIPLPVILVTAFPRTRLTIRAIKAGAATLLEKPYDDEELWDAVRKAIAEDQSKRGDYERREQIRSRYEQLTMPERQVMGMLIQGKSNKAIAHELHIGVRTVENRRSAVLAKMQAEGIVQLVRMVIDANLEDVSPRADA
jgi:two-component system, LuxR family, response regulator FixJ